MRAEAVKRFRERILKVFNIFLLLIISSSYSTFSFSKTAFKAAVKPSAKPMSGWERARFLSYPSVPQIEQNSSKSKSSSDELKLDSALGQYWALANIGFFEAFTPLFQPINPKIAPCSNQIVVAIIDTGVDYTHPDLIDSIWKNQKEMGAWSPLRSTSTDRGGCRDKSCNGIDDDNNGFVDDVVGWDFVHDVPAPFDTHGHGTHISGIVSGQAANGIGAAGVCPLVSIMALKYYDSSGVGYNNLQNTVKAIQYAVRNGAHIINYSGGGAEPAAAERMAVEEARRKGILFVAAAGNDSHNNDVIKYYPASYDLDNIISVASLNKDNEILPSSNYGPKTVHLAAPGLAIFSTLPNAKFGTMSGTSQATAFVTGAAALLASQVPQGSMDYKKIKGWLASSSKPIVGADKKSSVSGGILSIGKALAVQQSDMYRPLPSVTEVAVKPKH